MPADILGPGAWMRQGAELNPNPRTQSLPLSTLNPNPRTLSLLLSALNPNPYTQNLPLSTLNPNPRPSGRRSANGSHQPGSSIDSGEGSPTPWPWSGIDPEWVYAGGEEALLAQALRRMQAKVIREADPRLPVPERGKVRRPKDGELSDPIWRWGSEFRVRAVAADLCGRFFVQDRTLYWTDRPTLGQPLSIAGIEVMTIETITSAGGWNQQIDKVLRAAVEREDRLPEILTQAGNFWPFFQAITGIYGMAAPRTTELFDVAWQWTDQIVMAFKNQIADLRPSQRSSSVTPVIATPGHGSLPSGHATFAALTSELFTALLYPQGSERTAQLDRLARRISFNRVVAGVHYPVDNAAGYALGRQLAGWFVALAKGKSITPKYFKFSPDPAQQKDIQLLESAARNEIKMNGSRKPLAVPSLSVLWSAAQRELDQLRV